MRNVIRPKIKSGKFAKVNGNLQKQEVWPHTSVPLRYGRRMTFDTLDYESFTAGESKIILNMFKAQDEEAIGRLQVFNMVTNWVCRTRDWPLIRQIYGSHNGRN